MPKKYQITIRQGDRYKLDVSLSVFRAWTGERFVNGRRFFGRRFVYLTCKPYTGPNADVNGDIDGHWA